MININQEIVRSGVLTSDAGDFRQRTPSGPGQALIAEIKFISFINTWIHQARCQVIKRILCPENAEEVEGSAAWLHLNDSRSLTFAACHAAY